MKDFISEIESAQKKAEAPKFNVGDTVRVSNRIKEGNRERTQVFEGIVTAWVPGVMMLLQIW